MSKERVVFEDEISFHLIKGKHHNKRKILEFFNLDFFNKKGKRKNEN